MFDHQVTVVADLMDMDVRDHTVVGQRLAQGGKLVDADLELAQQRVRQTPEVVVPIRARGEHVGRLVDRHVVSAGW